MGEVIWILIPLAPFILGGFALWSNHKKTEWRVMSEINTEIAEQYTAQNERLEQRFQVLERIITDGNHDLAAKIEDLRDKALN